jgi:hypothetical protein
MFHWCDTMQESLEVMKTALRVLTALTEKCQPSPLDVDTLRQYAGPQPEGLGLEQFACDVIQKLLGRRTVQREQPWLTRKLLQAFSLVGLRTAAAQQPGSA